MSHHNGDWYTLKSNIEITGAHAEKAKKYYSRPRRSIDISYDGKRIIFEKAGNDEPYDITESYEVFGFNHKALAIPTHSGLLPTCNLFYLLKVKNADDIILNGSKYLINKQDYITWYNKQKDNKLKSWYASPHEVNGEFTFDHYSYSEFSIWLRDKNGVLKLVPAEFCAKITNKTAYTNKTIDKSLYGSITINNEPVSGSDGPLVLHQPTTGTTIVSGSGDSTGVGGAVTITGGTSVTVGSGTAISATSPGLTYASSPGLTTYASSPGLVYTSSTINCSDNDNANEEVEEETMDDNSYNSYALKKQFIPNIPDNIVEKLNNAELLEVIRMQFTTYSDVNELKYKNEFVEKTSKDIELTNRVKLDADKSLEMALFNHKFSFLELVLKALLFISITTLMITASGSNPINLFTNWM